MVQSASWESVSKEVNSNWNIPSKKSVWKESPPVQQVKEKRDKDNQLESSRTKQQGGWGPTFKNKEYFASLHHC
ncbi:hypothetical protein NQ317_000979 [Molorchus minor]|uniref:Uncharacterized protein n=1 Tax=Molorchus minor TaxID=1323400 RepID=A0ABQ9JNR0_9CUCU|nr:hypothetical protein NQ317_000979 [Molorchus minor]